MVENKVYFPGFNGIRAISAFAVIIHHIEQFKYWEGIPSLWELTFIKQLGNKAVGAFFVLSGFLITFLLINEKKSSKNIGIYRFYIRRILRIWPLYITVLLLVFLILPRFVFLSKFDNAEVHFWNNFLMYLFFLPHFAIFFLPPVLGATQFWSIGIEENFYLVWPLLVKFFFNNLWVVFGLILLVKIFGEIVLSLLSNKAKVFGVIFSFWKLFQIELLTIGSIGAIVVQFYKSNLQIIYNTYFQVFSYITIFCLLLLPDEFVGLSFLQGIGLIIIIINIGTNPKSIVKLNSPLLKLLGNISYGIYLWHVGIIAIAGFYLQKLVYNEANLLVFNILIYLIVFGLTIALALFSYKNIELPFLNLKRKYYSLNNSKR